MCYLVFSPQVHFVIQMTELLFSEMMMKATEPSIQSECPD